MAPYPNLISESLLVNETIELLRSNGGNASAVKVVDYVMNIPKTEPQMARMLVSDIIKTDPRLSLNDDRVELDGKAFENRNLDETDFVVFDLETTGAKTPPCRITEIGAYKIQNGEIAGEYQTLVNPETPIPPFITGLTGISDVMVKDAPKFSEISPGFMEFIGDAVLIAHNAHFDMRFLNHEIGRVHPDYRVGNPYLCTVQLSRKLLPEIPNHRLNTVAEYYSVKLENHHRATDDAYATAQIFINFLERLEERGIKDLLTARKFKK
jgi:DNA polymerase III epsilon subunit family exonuclease